MTPAPDQHTPSLESSPRTGGSTAKFLVWIALAFALLALANICAVLVCGAIPALDHPPYNSVWLQEYYPDLLLFKSRFQFFHSQTFFTYTGSTPFMYPAPNAVLYEVFYQLFGRHPVISFLLLGVASYTVAGCLFAKALIRHRVSPLLAAGFTVVVLLCCYPIGFELKQANIELAIWVLTAGGIAFFVAGKNYSAATCFAIAASMKIYPVIFFGLLLRRGKYKQIAFGAVAIVLITVVSLWLVCPSIPVASRGISSGLELFRTSYMLHVRLESGVDHSLFGLIKSLWRPTPDTAQLAIALRIYLASVALLGVGLFFFRIWHLPLVNQVLCLVIASILLPPTSFEYTLQHLLIPFAMFVFYLLADAAWRHQQRLILAYLTCFVIVLGAIPQIIHHNRRWEGPVKAVVLLVLFILALAKPVRTSPELSSQTV